MDTTALRTSVSWVEKKWWQETEYEPNTSASSPEWEDPELLKKEKMLDTHPHIQTPPLLSLGTAVEDFAEYVPAYTQDALAQLATSSELVLKAIQPSYDEFLAPLRTLLQSQVEIGEDALFRISLALAQFFRFRETLRSTELSVLPAKEYTAAEPDPLRRQEFAWLDAHSDEVAEYAGLWVAIQGKELAAHGSSLQETLDQARDAGFPHPLVLKLPPATEEDILLAV